MVWTPRRLEGVLERVESGLSRDQAVGMSFLGHENESYCIYKMHITTHKGGLNNFDRES